MGTLRSKISEAGYGSRREVDQEIKIDRQVIFTDLHLQLLCDDLEFVCD
jgi:hypothetical protein